ncbi:MAG: LacI family DNA-binding transcriptional regulator [Pseudomonadota bacterium]
MARQPTLKDVAQIANVSEMTVSRVLRGKGDTTETTRARVLKAAKQIGYVPNRIAGSLSSQRVDLVGLIVPSLSNMVFSEVVMGVSKGLEGSVLQPVFGLSHYDLETEEKVILEMLSWRPSGLIVAGLEHTPNATRAMAAADIPIVEIMDTDGHPTDYNVGISQIQAGVSMAEAFLSRGYQNIGFIGSKMPADFRAQKRLKGFEDTLAAAGQSLTHAVFHAGGSSLRRGRDMTAALLKDSPEIDGIYYSTDLLAAGGLLHCLDEGIAVPGDVALAGFNGLDLLDGLPKRIATTDAGRFASGFEAAQIVQAALQGTPIERVLRLDAELDIGDTL